VGGGFKIKTACLLVYFFFWGGGEGAVGISHCQ
jgi:hypothetical protein